MAQNVFLPTTFAEEAGPVFDVVRDQEEEASTPESEPQETPENSQETPEPEPEPAAPAENQPADNTDQPTETDNPDETPEPESTPEPQSQPESESQPQPTTPPQPEPEPEFAPDNLVSKISQNINDNNGGNIEVGDILTYTVTVNQFIDPSNGIIPRLEVNLPIGAARFINDSLSVNGQSVRTALYNNYRDNNLKVVAYDPALKSESLVMTFQVRVLEPPLYFANAATPATINILDRSSGQTALVAELEDKTNVFAIAISPNGQQIYGLDSSDNQFFAYNILTQDVTDIGIASQEDLSVSCLDFNNTGDLYGIDSISNQILSFNLTTGQSQVVNQLRYSDGEFFNMKSGSCSFEGNTLYVISNTTAELTGQLFRTDINSGVVELIGDSNTPEFFTGLTQDYQDRLYATGKNNDSLYLIDPETLNVNPLAELDISHGGGDLTSSHEAQINFVSETLFYPNNTESHTLEATVSKSITQAPTKNLFPVTNAPQTAEDEETESPEGAEEISEETPQTTECLFLPSITTETSGPKVIWQNSCETTLLATLWSAGTPQQNLQLEIYKDNEDGQFSPENDYFITNLNTNESGQIQIAGLIPGNYFMAIDRSAIGLSAPQIQSLSIPGNIPNYELNIELAPNTDGLQGNILADVQYPTDQDGNVLGAGTARPDSNNFLYFAILILIVAIVVTTLTKSTKEFFWKKWSHKHPIKAFFKKIFPTLILLVSFGTALALPQTTLADLNVQWDYQDAEELVIPGSIITYKVTYYNPNETPETNGTIEVALPSNVEYVSDSLGLDLDDEDPENHEASSTPQTDTINDDSAEYFENINRIRFDLGQVNPDTYGFAIFQVRVTDQAFEAGADAIFLEAKLYSDQTSDIFLSASNPLDYAGFEAPPAAVEIFPNDVPPSTLEGAFRL